MKLSQEENKINYNNFITLLNKKKLIDTYKNYKYWGNIPIEVKYLEPLYKIYKKNMKFIDLGCGVGNVLRYAKNIGFKVKGIEFNSEYTKHLKQYDFEEKNILDTPFSDFKEYDVVYLYRPLKNNLKEYINNLCSSIELKTYILCPDFNIENRSDLEKVDNFLYRKIRK